MIFASLWINMLDEIVFVQPEKGLLDRVRWLDWLQEDDCQRASYFGLVGCEELYFRGVH